MKTCPKCGGPLTVAYKEHVDYPVENIEEDNIDIEEHNSNCYDSSLIHIACDKCSKYWYSLSDFWADVRKAGDTATFATDTPFFVAIGPDELDDTQEVHAGDEILCPTCKEWHQLIAGKDSKGVDSELLLAYKCGDKTYIAAVDNKLVIKWPKGPGVTKFRKGPEKPKEG